MAKLALDTAVCTGCGACVSICPVQAVRMTHDVRNNNE
ncbi:MAG: 4Fe-4S binding protein [Plesiomonas shigelloides]